MNIGTIVTSGTKGQIVIPQKMRDELGITPDTPLEVRKTGSSITIHPVAGIVRKADEETSAAAILVMTQGLWGSKTEKNTDQAEKDRSLRLKNSW